MAIAPPGNAPLVHAQTRRVSVCVCVSSRRYRIRIDGPSDHDAHGPHDEPGEGCASGVGEIVHSLQRQLSFTPSSIFLLPARR